MRNGKKPIHHLPGRVPLGRAGGPVPQTPMRLVHGSPFSLLFAHDVETAGLQRSLCVASHRISHAALEDAPERSVEVGKITQVVNRSGTSPQIQRAIHHFQSAALISCQTSSPLSAINKKEIHLAELCDEKEA